jgi:hypothetical protein
MSCGVTFGYGALGGNSNGARLTHVVFVDEPGDKKRIQIPPYAKSWTGIVMNGSTGCAVSGFGFGAGLRANYALTSPLSNVGQQTSENAFPVFNGERFLEVTNTNQAGPLAVVLIFGLAFG